MKLILLALLALTTNAATITSGSINFTAANIAPTFDFVSDRQVTGSFAPGIQSDRCHPCEGSYSIGGYSTDFRNGTLDGEPVRWANPYTSSRFDWVGDDIQINGAGTYQSTFSMTGTLCADSWDAGTSSTCPTAFAYVSGSGTAALTVIAGGNYLWATGLTLTFEEQLAPQAMRLAIPNISNPEPGTLVLIAGGLLVLGLRRGRWLN